MIKDQLIGIAGRKGSGKTVEVSQYLIQYHGFTRISFADPLKNMLLSFGLTREQLWGDEKETALEILGGQTPRHAMQTLGTEWGRNLIYDEIWLNAWERAFNKCTSPVVVDDLRFINEGEVIKKLGGKILLIERPEVESKDLHQSEVEISKIPYDYKIINDGSSMELRAKISELMEELAKNHRTEIQNRPSKGEEKKEIYAQNLTLPAKDWEPKYKRDAACKGSEQEKAKFLKE